MFRAATPNQNHAILDNPRMSLYCTIVSFVDANSDRALLARLRKQPSKSQRFG